MTRADAESALAQAVQHLPDHEVRVLAKIATRFVRGCQEYGPLHRGKRRWRREAAEEAFDATIYLAILLDEDETR